MFPGRNIDWEIIRRKGLLSELEIEESVFPEYGSFHSQEF
jgi:hypothetical protein